MTKYFSMETASDLECFICKKFNISLSLAIMEDLVVFDYLGSGLIFFLYQQVPINKGFVGKWWFLWLYTIAEYTCLDNSCRWSDFYIHIWMSVLLLTDLYLSVSMLSENTFRAEILKYDTCYALNVKIFAMKQNWKCLV